MSRITIFTNLSKQHKYLYQMLLLLRKKIIDKITKFPKKIISNRDVIFLLNTLTGKQKIVADKFFNYSEKFNIITLSNILLSKNNKFQIFIKEQIRMLNTKKSSLQRFKSYLNRLKLSHKGVRYIKKNSTQGYYAIVTYGWKKQYEEYFTKSKMMIDGSRPVFLNIEDVNKITNDKF